MEVIHEEMTNKEAAAILRAMANISLMHTTRVNGKTRAFYRHVEAYRKAIELLENTPD